jgi:hypothetical protein
MPGGSGGSGGEGAMLVVAVFAVMIAVTVIIRIAAGGLDHDRIREYIEQRGGRILETNWSPMGPGWIGEKSDRIYNVRYVDRDGNEHEAHCKTSLWSGVYLTDDRTVRHGQQAVIEPTATPAGHVDLAEENRQLRAESQRLRAEVEQLRRRQGDA